MGEDRGKSEFNGAISYLNRLNALFYVADEASMSLDANGWFHSLQALYRELSTEFSDKEKEKMKQMRDTSASLLQTFNNTKKSKGSAMVSTDFYNSLDALEIELRRIMKDAGLQYKTALDFTESENW